MTAAARTSEGAPVAPPADGVPWTVLGLMRWSGQYLDSKGVERGRLDAEHLLAHVLGVDRMRLYLDFERPLAPEELERFKPLLLRRARREPLQYIVRRAAFRELELEVGPDVLIPRSETEELVEHVLHWARAQGRTDLTALDVGTGSGAIALSLAAEGPFGEVVATDISDEALETAARNAHACGLAERVRFRSGSLFAPLAEDEAFDVVVSNPPYVTEGELEGLQPEVRNWEPRSALVAGADGLAVLGPLVREASGHLRPGGLVAVELSPSQAEAVARLAEETHEYEDIRIRRDLAGRQRVVTMRRAGNR